jgi:hypothetical protein
MHSLEWRDRNKTSVLVESFTRSRDPVMLKALRQEMLAPLVEMARWHSPGHAMTAIEALGRIAGMSEDQIDVVTTTHDVSSILAALNH